MNNNSDVQNTIVIDKVEAIEARGEYLIIKPHGYKNRVAIKDSELASIVNFGIRHYRLKVTTNG